MANSKLFIRGLKDPIIINEAQAREARSVLEDVTIAPTERIGIGELWTGYKSDMRYVITEKDDYSYSKDTRKYSDQELNLFEKELSPYLLKEGDPKFNELVEQMIQDVKSEKPQFVTSSVLGKINYIKAKNMNDEEVRNEVVEYISNTCVGSLYKDGEINFLLSKKAITVDSHNVISIVREKSGYIPYEELSKKLSEYKQYKGRKAYAEKKALEQLDELAGSMRID